MENHKLVFRRIEAKNFRSVGNMPIDIVLDESGTTLVSSTDNGAGKSTVVGWALYFALFGKPYGNGCLKASLVNSKNNKDCLTTVEFFTKGCEWRVIRGIKPNVFEIYFLNNSDEWTLVPPEADLKLYQSYLESLIGMDAQIFQNVVYLGPDKFVPFMNMTTGDRRHVVEEILDLSVFSNMNEVTKNRIKTLKREMDDANYQVGITESQINAQTRIIESKKTQKDDTVGSAVAEIEKLTKEREEFETKVASLDLKKISLDESAGKIGLKDYSREINELNNIMSRFTAKIRDHEASKSRFDAMGICPTCNQVVGSGVKDKIAQENNDEIKKLEDGYEKMKVMVTGHTKNQENWIKYKTAIDDIWREQNELSTSIRVLDGRINTHNALIAKASTQDNDITRDMEVLKEIEEKLVNLQNTYQEKSDSLMLHNAAIQLLKDDAVKGNIISQYIPYFVSKVNMFLNDMNMYINFNVSPNFDVTIESPERKNQNIYSLSTGQLCRINLAVLFAWREISKLKSSVSTNLLVLDETLENLSEQGVRDFMALFASTMQDTCLFTITQRESEFSEYFEKSIKFHLKDDFTVMM